VNIFNLLCPARELYPEAVVVDYAKESLTGGVAIIARFGLEILRKGA